MVLMSLQICLFCAGESLQPQSKDLYSHCTASVYVLQTPIDSVEGIMKIGVNMTLSSRSIDVALLAHKAESLGFESLWLPEHPVIPVHVTTHYQGSSDGAVPPSMSDMADPFMALARASA